MIGYEGTSNTNRLVFMNVYVQPDTGYTLIQRIIFISNRFEPVMIV